MFHTRDTNVTNYHTLYIDPEAHQIVIPLAYLKVVAHLFLQNPHTKGKTYFGTPPMP